MEKNKWYDAKQSNPPVGEYVCLAVKPVGVRYWIRALHVSDGEYIYEGVGKVSPSIITHFMIPSDPME